jgi:phage FluMu protein Com
MTFSLIHRLGQNVRIAYHNSTVSRTVAGTVAGACGAGIGAWHTHVYVLALASLVGAIAGLVASILLHAVVYGRHREMPTPLQPISERRVLEVLELLPHDALCGDCVELLATNPVSHFLTVECPRCESIARHREVQFKAVTRLRSVLPLPSRLEAYLDQEDMATANRHWVA